MAAEMRREMGANSALPQGLRLTSSKVTQSASSRWHVDERRRSRSICAHPTPHCRTHAFLRLRIRTKNCAADRALVPEAARSKYNLSLMGSSTRAHIMRCKTRLARESRLPRVALIVHRPAL
eukprot:1839050-Pyramimonas_sp.AAC.1